MGAILLWGVGECRTRVGVGRALWSGAGEVHVVCSSQLLSANIACTDVGALSYKFAFEVRGKYLLKVWLFKYKMSEEPELICYPRSGI